MTALTQARPTPEHVSNLRAGELAAGAKIYGGSLVARDAEGNLVKGSTATGLVGVGMANHDVDNTLGVAGAAVLEYKVGCFRFDNSAGADALTKADIGKVAWIVDDQTVARTSATNTRSRAGIVRSVEIAGVWIEFNEALARVATPAAA